MLSSNDVGTVVFWSKDLVDRMPVAASIVLSIYVKLLRASRHFVAFQRCAPV